MALGIDLFRSREVSVSTENHTPGIRTRALLLVSLVLIIVGTTASSLFIIRNQLRLQVRANLETDLGHSVETFQDLDAGRLVELEHEGALLAALPSLKALMTTRDPRTITDDAVDFWKTSGNDLFALSDPSQKVQAAYAKGATNTDVLKRDLQSAVTDLSQHYLLSNGRLFEYSVRPLYFGRPEDGTLLGYVISGYAIDEGFLQEVGRGAGAEVAFLAGNSVVVSTLANGRQLDLGKIADPQQQNGTASIATVGRERYLSASKDLTSEAGSPLRLVVMKSFDAADRAEMEIDRLVMWVSILAIAAGSVLMILLARMVTRPLEKLAAGVRAFGEGNSEHSLPAGGTEEVRYLSRVFAKMRDEIEKTHRALLESERLATIGRMASSVSHDLRHYFAAIYANAEFLASPVLPASERAELYEEIRLAIDGTTDMLDSLLIFSRTGSSLHRVFVDMTMLVEHAIALVNTHPDAQGMKVILEKGNADTSVEADTKQVERAVYNLLLNACQSARKHSGPRIVKVSVSAESQSISVAIMDNGPGVAEEIRETMFDPFVSQGKQKGTGLGLTLASSVAREHGGDVKLVSSRDGETIFQLTVARNLTESAENGSVPRSKVLTQ
jgi:signal transduction histidine kinase